MEMLKWMAICLTLTIIIETTVAFILKLRKTDLLIVVLVNILTNPLVVSMSHYFNIKYGHNGYTYSLITLELLTFITEGLIYKYNLDNKKINPFIISLILNLTSYLFGLIINNFMI